MSTEPARQPLTREEVIDAVERRKSGRIPMFLVKWWGVGMGEKYGDKLRYFDERYPDDIFAGWHVQPGGITSPYPDSPNYRFGYSTQDYSNAEYHGTGHTPVLLTDWDDLDTFIDEFPDPHEEHIFDPIKAALPSAGNRYKLGCFWSVFHEKFWGVRGMENLMCDYYENMDKLKRMAAKYVEFHKVIIDRYADLGFDGIFTSDDLGHQGGPMMSPAIFEDFYYPLYCEVISHAHKRGMHFWLHSCGDNTLLLPYLIDAGLDVFHPIQRGCMDMHRTAELYNGQISFLYGIDVQHILPEETPERVREEVRDAIRTLQTDKGGLLFAAGNGIMPDTPLENIDAMLDEICKYQGR